MKEKTPQHQQNQNSRKVQEPKGTAPELSTKLFRTTTSSTTKLSTGARTKQEYNTYLLKDQNKLFVSFTKQKENNKSEIRSDDNRNKKNNFQIVYLAKPNQFQDTGVCTPSFLAENICHFY
ncbi:hypothetical protein M0813_29515 [Anaeramoeba flamelloides]|uniref:Uncharacterized protein n=1 Tax=Anaeramoeba flamelloides TaxID=1746091 RepID=A0ABQ8XP11_9EUKA|nr:hypothetical protein M0813_29515 [Anaeramoeba flamelloides]